MKIRGCPHPGKQNVWFRPLEQHALFDLLMEQSIRNPDETDLKEEIKRMLASPRFDIRSPK